MCDFPNNLGANLNIFTSLAHLYFGSKLVSHYLKFTGFIFVSIKLQIIFDTDFISRKTVRAEGRKQRKECFQEAMKMLTCKM